MYDNRGCKTVHIESLNEYQSIFSIIPPSANFDELETYDGHINNFFDVTELLNSFANKYFPSYIHNILRLEIIIEEYTIRFFFLLHWCYFGREICQLISRFM